MMSDQQPSSIPRAASAASLALAVMLALSFLVTWYMTSQTHFLLLGLGFALVSPIWYRSPIFLRYISLPMGSSPVYKQEFTPIEGLLSLAGYATISIGLVLWALRHWA